MLYHTAGELQKLHSICDFDFNYELRTRLGRWVFLQDERLFEKFYDVFNNVETQVNTESNVPVLMSASAHTTARHEDLFVPILSDIHFHKILSAHDVWAEVYNFISSTKDISVENTQTDVDKIQSHGFDKKKSFRHRKKLDK